MNPDSSRPPATVLRLLLAMGATAVAAALAAGIGWYRSAHRPIRLDDLQPSERQQLVEEMSTASPGAFEPAWFEPRIGYTLKRGADLEIWKSKFRSNRLGYRTGRVEKEPGTFRILFLGDSWTYGMGISRADSFPEVLAGLVNGRQGGPRVESWTLALPGYNLLNEVAACEFWQKALEPDAVVVVPSSNDDESTPQVAPNGQLFVGAAGPGDAFGEPHAVWNLFSWQYDGYRTLTRWRMSFDRVRALELELGRHGVPLALFFVARWRPPVVHRFVAEAGLEAPYAIVPESLTLGEWLTDLPNPHGNARANRVYARILYRLLAPPLGWPALTDSDPTADRVPIYAHVPPRDGWEKDARELLRQGTRHFVPESFRPGADGARAWSGPGDPATGEIGLATTLLVHPPAGTRELEIRLRRIGGLDAIYPLGFTVSVPSAGGGTRLRAVLPADGAPERVFRIAVPADRDGDQALEVVFVADRITAAPPSLIAKSFAIRAVRAAP